MKHRFNVKGELGYNYHDIKISREPGNKDSVTVFIDGMGRLYIDPNTKRIKFFDVDVRDWVERRAYLFDE